MRDSIKQTCRSDRRRYEKRLCRGLVTMMDCPISPSCASLCAGRAGIVMAVLRPTLVGPDTAMELWSVTFLDH